MSLYTAVTSKKISVTQFCESIIHSLIKKVEVQPVKRNTFLSMRNEENVLSVTKKWLNKVEDNMLKRLHLEFRLNVPSV